MKVKYLVQVLGDPEPKYYGVDSFTALSIFKREQKAGRIVTEFSVRGQDRRVMRMWAPPAPGAQS